MGQAQQCKMLMILSQQSGHSLAICNTMGQMLWDIVGLLAFNVVYYDIQTEFGLDFTNMYELC